MIRVGEGRDLRVFGVVAGVVLIDVRLYVVYAATSGTLTLGLDMRLRGNTLKGLQCHRSSDPSDVGHHRRVHACLSAEAAVPG